MKIKLINGHSRMHSSGIYKEKYREKANQFWALQEKDKTDEEREYDNLIEELQKMLVSFKEEIEFLERENSDLQAQMADANKVKAQYQLLKEEQSQLCTLKKEIEYYHRK